MFASNFDFTGGSMFSNSPLCRGVFRSVLLGACISVFTLTQAQQPVRRPSARTVSASPATVGTGAQRLPLRRIILYKSGVGYFEHAGQVRGNQDIQIDLTSSQLDDILKSLTALDLNGGRIAGARYNSQDSTAHHLALLPISMEETPTLPALLRVLRGSRLEVRSGAAKAYRFRIEVPSKQTKTLILEERRPIVTEYELNDLEDEEIQTILIRRDAAPEIEKVLQ